MADSITAGVVGAGYIGEEHVRAYAEHPLVDLAAVVDLDWETAEAVADEYGTTAYTDLEDALAADLDLLTVATPETAHRHPTETALAAGVPVLLEKPIAADVEAALAIGEAVEASPAHLLMGYVCRFHPRYAALRREVEAGTFGDLLSLQAARVSPRWVYEAVADWSHPLFYLAVHDVDAIRWLADEEVAEVHARASDSVAGKSVPAVVHATLELADGTVASLETNFAKPDAFPADRTDEVRITGTEGYGRLLTEAAGDDGVRVATDEEFRYGDTGEVDGRTTGMLREEVDHFVRTVADGREPAATWVDGLRGLEVVTALRESIETGDPVPVDRHEVGESGGDANA